MLLSNQQKYILEILKEFKYLRVRQLYALVQALTVHRESKLTKGAWRSCFARCAQAPIMSGCGVMWFLTETAG